MDAIHREKPRKEGNKQTVVYGTVLLPLGLLVLVNSSHKKHSGRYPVSGLLYKIPVLAWCSWHSPLVCETGKLHGFSVPWSWQGQRKSICWSTKVRDTHTHTICKALNSHAGKDMYLLDWCTILEQTCMLKIGRQVENWQFLWALVPFLISLSSQFWRWVEIISPMRCQKTNTGAFS